MSNILIEKISTHRLGPMPKLDMDLYGSAHHRVGPIKALDMHLHCSALTACEEFQNMTWICMVQHSQIGTNARIRHASALISTHRFVLMSELGMHL